VQFVKGLETLRAAGVTLFIEVGPKKALQGFVDDVLGDDAAVASLFTNHPKLTDTAAFNQALCGLYAAGLGMGATAEDAAERRLDERATAAPSPAAPRAVAAARRGADALAPRSISELGRLFAEFLGAASSLYGGGRPPSRDPTSRWSSRLRSRPAGLPRVFDDSNAGRLLRGEQLIGVVPSDVRNGMADKHIVRLVKSEVGESRFETIDDVAEVIKLAGRAGALDLEREFGVSAERIPALDVVTRLAIGAGLEALRDAGIPLVMRYKTTTRGRASRPLLPDRSATTRG
jgi:hypothetical protein